ncbi:hypothetical protein P4B35_06595 [Pontiellaceae bacterium B12227]|nr:hypothetical protein [Pontiellaceae bacterium B12227]
MKYPGKQNVHVDCLSFRENLAHAVYKAESRFFFLEEPVTLSLKPKELSMILKKDGKA